MSISFSFFVKYRKNKKASTYAFLWKLKCENLQLCRVMKIEYSVSEFNKMENCYLQQTTTYTQNTITIHDGNSFVRKHKVLWSFLFSTIFSQCFLLMQRREKMNSRLFQFVWFFWKISLRTHCMTLWRFFPLLTMRQYFILNFSIQQHAVLDKNPSSTPAFP
jgi:hypothetical protein